MTEQLRCDGLADISPFTAPSSEVRRDSDLPAQLYRELAPATAFEKYVASNIVANEEQALKLRNIREAILRHNAGDWIARQLQRSLARAHLPGQEMSSDAIRDLVRLWIRGSKEASDTIAELGIDTERALTDAYIDHADQLNTIDKQLYQLEARRSRLHEDYRRMQAARRLSGPIEDAEIVTGAP